MPGLVVTLLPGQLLDGPPVVALEADHGQDGDTWDARGRRNQPGNDDLEEGARLLLAGGLSLFGRPNQLLLVGGYERLRSSGEERDGAHDLDLDVGKPDAGPARAP